jgi:hypothetical protein
MPSLCPQAPAMPFSCRPDCSAKLACQIRSRRPSENRIVWQSRSGRPAMHGRCRTAVPRRRRLGPDTYLAASTRERARAIPSSPSLAPSLSRPWDCPRLHTQPSFTILPLSIASAWSTPPHSSAARGPRPFASPRRAPRHGAIRIRQRATSSTRCAPHAAAPVPPHHYLSNPPSPKPCWRLSSRSATVCASVARPSCARSRSQATASWKRWNRISGRL